MRKDIIPNLSALEIKGFFELATSSKRKRYPKILHNKGDKFNKVFNFLIKDTYMQPHLHPGKEKIEHIYIVRGKIAIIFFDDVGNISEYFFLGPGGYELREVPAYTWHTYVVLSEEAITYETMMGVYDLKTWKNLAAWAPAEDKEERNEYLDFLKNKVK
jgi:cupin fold WbuC family metalloprotein